MSRPKIRSGLVASWNQYKQGRGNDRQVYVSLWAGDTIVTDRRSDRDRDGGPVFVVHPFAAIVGGIQPAVLDALRGHSRMGDAPPEDGWLDRFLLAFPADLPATGEQWQAAAFAVASDHGLDAKAAFNALYLAFLGRPNGPRAGWLLASLDRAFVVHRLREAGTVGETVA